MPSTLHEALVLLFRESPRLAPMLLGRALGVDIGVWLPEDADIQITSAELADLDPPEYRADVVLRIPDDSDDKDRDKATREVFIVEVQLDPDPRKHFTWPQYVTSARTRFRCPATLVVVAVDERVARWCAQPITLDRAGNVFRPVVVGPAAIPAVTDEAQARTWPDLAVLSVIAHGHEPGSEAIGAVALAACDRLDNPTAAYTLTSSTPISTRLPAPPWRPSCSSTTTPIRATSPRSTSPKAPRKASHKVIERCFASNCSSALVSCPPTSWPGSMTPMPTPWIRGEVECSPPPAWPTSSPPSRDSSACARPVADPALPRGQTGAGAAGSLSVRRAAMAWTW
jgi:hypothetical protein